MRSVTALVISAASSLATLSSAAAFEKADAQRLENSSVMTLMWDDLLPAGEDQRLTEIYENYYADLEQRFLAAEEADQMGLGGIQEGSSLDTMPQLGTFNTVSGLNGQRVEIPGFLVPLDATAKSVTTFLVVPYYGACLHTPPPPPNQIVFVEADPPMKSIDLYSPYWFEGVLETKRKDTDLGNTAYSMKLKKVRLYN